MANCLIGLGSNLGDRAAQLDQACRAIANHPQIWGLVRSRYHATTPVGGPSGQPDFLNAVVRAQTSMPPEELLNWLLQTERKLGRVAGTRWGPRVLDLDLLLYDELVVSRPGLELPHPRMAFRRFVLEPAADVAPAFVHPTTGWTIARLLEHLDFAANYVALSSVGQPADLAATVARMAPARLLGGPLVTGDEPRRVQNSRHAKPSQVDPAGRFYRSQIELLQQRARLLAANTWLDETRFAVSDFWFDDSIVQSRHVLTGPEWDSLCKLWQSLLPAVTAPKLLVLAASPGPLANTPNEGQQPGLDQLLHQAIREQAWRCHQGPVLFLEHGDIRSSALEVVAAIHAMR